MLLNDVPSLGCVNGGSALRMEATKIHNRAAIMRDMGNTSLDTELIEFWTWQRTAVDIHSSHPTDGPTFSGEAGKMRKLCYNVLSSIRMHGYNKDDVARWQEFCMFFFNDAGGVVEQDPEPEEPVTEPEALKAQEGTNGIAS